MQIEINKDMLRTLMVMGGVVEARALTPVDICGGCRNMPNAWQHSWA